MEKVLEGEKLRVHEQFKNVKFIFEQQDSGVDNQSITTQFIRESLGFIVVLSISEYDGVLKKLDSYLKLIHDRSSSNDPIIWAVIHKSMQDTENPLQKSLEKEVNKFMCLSIIDIEEESHKLSEVLDKFMKCLGQKWERI